MRTIAEVEMEFNRINDRWSGDAHEEGDRSDEGMLMGFKTIMRWIGEGKTLDEMIALTRKDENGYHSWGDDYADAEQSGFICALYWGCEQYDWTEDGQPIFREGNILGQPADKG